MNEFYSGDRFANVPVGHDPMRGVIRRDFPVHIVGVFPPESLSPEKAYVSDPNSQPYELLKYGQIIDGETGKELELPLNQDVRILR